MSLRWDTGLKWDIPKLISLVCLWYVFLSCFIAKTQSQWEINALACFRPGFVSLLATCCRSDQRCEVRFGLDVLNPESPDFTKKGRTWKGRKCNLDKNLECVRRNKRRGPVAPKLTPQEKLGTILERETRGPHISVAFQHCKCEMVKFY